MVGLRFRTHRMCWTPSVSPRASLAVPLDDSAGELIYNLFDNGKDVQFYMSPDIVNGLCVENITRSVQNLPMVP